MWNLNYNNFRMWSRNSFSNSLLLHFLGNYSRNTILNAIRNIWWGILYTGAQRDLLEKFYLLSRFMIFPPRNRENYTKSIFSLGRD